VDDDNEEHHPTVGDDSHGQQQQQEQPPAAAVDDDPLPQQEPLVALPQRQTGRFMDANTYWFPRSSNDYIGSSASIKVISDDVEVPTDKSAWNGNLKFKRMTKGDLSQPWKDRYRLAKGYKQKHQVDADFLEEFGGQFYSELKQMNERDETVLHFQLMEIGKVRKLIQNHITGKI
jgi:hypothetical protein